MIPIQEPIFVSDPPSQYRWNGRIQRMTCIKQPHAPTATDGIRTKNGITYSKIVVGRTKKEQITEKFNTGKGKTMNDHDS